MQSGYLSAPEGRYNLFSERQTGIHNFTASRSTKLTFADLLKSEEGRYVLFNVSDYIHICNYSHTGKASAVTLHAVE